MVEETEEEWHRSKVSSPGALLQFIRIVGRSVKGPADSLEGVLSTAYRSDANRIGTDQVYRESSEE
jgi:hypothetical protein